MNRYNQKNLGIFIQIFREATVVEMILIAVIVFPALLSPWNSIIQALLPNKDSLRSGILLASCITLTGLMINSKIKSEESQETLSKLEILKRLVIQSMLDRKIQVASYDRIRQNLPNNPDWNDQFFDKLVERYPEIFSFRRIRNNDGENPKPGLALISNDEVVDEEIDQKNQLEELKELVIEFVSTKNKQLASYDRIRQNLPNNPDWNDQFFDKLVRTYPEIFSSRKIRNNDGENPKPGLALISNNEVVDNDDDD